MKSHYFLPHPDPSKHGHHRRSLFLSYKALFTYSIFLLALLLTTTLARHQLPGILGFASNITFNDLLLETNKERLASGLNSLTVSEKLNQAALAKANYMFKYDFWAHVAPDGTEPWYFFTEAGYDYRFAGENLARDFGNSKDVVEAWLDSPSHRENLLSSNYTDIGFAVVNGNLDGLETTLVVQLFGKPIQSNQLAATPPEAAKTEQAVNTPQLLITPAKSWPLPQTVMSGEVLPAINVFNASRGVTLSLGAFLTLLFALDGYLAWRWRILRLSGNTVAHLAILILAIVGIWYTNVGVIV